MIRVAPAKYKIGAADTDGAVLEASDDEDADERRDSVLEDEERGAAREARRGRARGRDGAAPGVDRPTTQARARRADAGAQGRGPARARPLETQRRPLGHRPLHEAASRPRRKNRRVADEARDLSDGFAATRRVYDAERPWILPSRGDAAAFDVDVLAAAERRGRERSASPQVPALGLPHVRGVDLHRHRDARGGRIPARRRDRPVILDQRVRGHDLHHRHTRAVRPRVRSDGAENRRRPDAGHKVGGPSRPLRDAGTRRRSAAAFWSSPRRRLSSAI